MQIALPFSQRNKKRKGFRKFLLKLCYWGSVWFQDTSYCAHTGTTLLFAFFFLDIHLIVLVESGKLDIEGQYIQKALTRLLDIYNLILLLFRIFAYAQFGVAGAHFSPIIKMRFSTKVAGYLRWLGMRVCQISYLGFGTWEIFYAYSASVREVRTQKSLSCLLFSLMFWTQGGQCIMVDLYFKE